MEEVTHLQEVRLKTGDKCKISVKSLMTDLPRSLTSMTANRHLW